MQVSNVSSSTPAAIRFSVVRDWIVAFDSVGVLADVVGPGTTCSLPAIDELSVVDGLLVVDGVASGDSILPLSLAQPPTISPTKRIQIPCLSIKVPPVKSSAQLDLRTTTTRRFILGESLLSPWGKHCTAETVSPAPTSPSSDELGGY